MRNNDNTQEKIIRAGRKELWQRLMQARADARALVESGEVKPRRVSIKVHLR